MEIKQGYVAVKVQCEASLMRWKDAEYQGRGPVWVEMYVYVVKADGETGVLEGEVADGGSTPRVV